MNLKKMNPIILSGLIGAVALLISTLIGTFLEKPQVTVNNLQEVLAAKPTAIKSEHGERFGRENPPPGVFEKKTTPKNGNPKYVYVTKYGKKYHKKNCPFLRKSKIKIKFDEIGNRYTPCSRCFPHY